MAHDHNPEAEAILDQYFPVLGNGFVRLVDYLGGDQRIVDAARVSYSGKEVKTFRRNKGLIRYLMEHRHTSPFEQVILTFHVKLPIFVARQWIRHRTARLNEISGRYSVLEEDFYVPSAEDVRYQSKTNRQGGAEEEVPPELRQKVLEIITRQQTELYGAYKEMVEADIARELARINLPLSIYTAWYWQIDLHNLFHFLKLRLDAHAQYEIRCYAEKMLEMARAVAPLAVGAFEEFELHGRQFSKTEMDALRGMLKGEPHGLEGQAKIDFEEKLGI
ncbi:MAG: FAD-dependent thymidylate synthase [bacterium]